MWFSFLSLPFVGSLAVCDIGLPLFTIAIGLLDGFNPCAMWVLLFLLSLLSTYRAARRCPSFAGTFVAASGLAYFAFIAAWLNGFMLVWVLRRRARHPCHGHLLRGQPQLEGLFRLWPGDRSRA